MQSNFWVGGILMVVVMAVAVVWGGGCGVCVCIYIYHGLFCWVYHMPRCYDCIYFTIADIRLKIHQFLATVIINNYG